ncbi:MAG: lipopolysaccharide assembly protein LapA domain-containing protein [Pacificimonas sp.]
MRFITLLVYIVIGALVAWFSFQNLQRVEMWLPGGYEAYWPLAAYLLLALLLGALPVSLFHSISRWRWKRRVRKLEAELDSLRGPALPGERRADYAPPPELDRPTPTL